MIYWTKYEGHEGKILGKRSKVDNNIYSFDIETTSFLVLNNEQLKPIYYLEFDDKTRHECKYYSTMYIWMFSINDTVYYGRTWDEFKEFINLLDYYIPEKKYVFVHNLSFEFQFLRSVFNVHNVMARKSRNVMTFELYEYNIEFRCTYKMSNCKLEKLPEIFKLPIEKLVGNLDYSKIRHSKTVLTEKELSYCENDCLVIYYYIIEELKQYERVDKIPITSTGHVRRELKKKVLNDYSYRNKVYKAINTNPHIYNLLMDAFMGGYTHANWIYADTILKNVDSWDFTSSYPYVLTTSKYPSTEFKKCNLTRRENMIKKFAYLLVVKFKDLKCKYYNNFISASKCRGIRGAKYDNGRIISADELEMTLTDIDFNFILDTYDCEYEIIESYKSLYNYLPKQFIDFILEKYVKKTEYKDVEGKEIEYNLEKQKFNSLYGMSVTNMIKDTVIYDNINGWQEVPLINEEIEDMLNKEKKKSFLSFAYGVWVTAHARNNLLRNVIKLDEFVIYCDTDSMKLAPGYNKDIILKYNDIVKRKVDFVSKLLGIDLYKYSPKDVKGRNHLLGLFEMDAHYIEFITQGAKKYAVKIFDEKENTEKIKITVAGVPKGGAIQLKDLNDFRDDFVFDYKYTNKLIIFYNDEQEPFDLIDEYGIKYTITDKTGCCLVPTTYTLGKSLEYANLITDISSKRARYKE